MGNSGLKWVKGHNGQRRKLARAVAHLEKMRSEGARFTKMWKWWQRYEPIACLFKYQNICGADLVDKAWSILGEAASGDSENDLLTDYWHSQDIFGGL